MSRDDQLREALVSCLAFGSWDVRHALARMLGVEGPNGSEKDRLPAAYRIADALLPFPAELLVRLREAYAENDTSNLFDAVRDLLEVRNALLSRPAEGTGEAVRHDCEEWHNEGIGCTHCHAVLYPPAPAVSEAHPDTKRLDWLEAQAIKLHDYQIGWAQAGHESGEYGEYLSKWDGGFYVIGCDVDGLYDHTSLRNAIDAALAAQGGK